MTKNELVSIDPRLSDPLTPMNLHDPFCDSDIFSVNERFLKPRVSGFQEKASPILKSPSRNSFLRGSTQNGINSFKRKSNTLSRDDLFEYSYQKSPAKSGNLSKLATCKKSRNLKIDVFNDGISEYCVTPKKISQSYSAPPRTNNHEDITDFFVAPKYILPSYEYSSMPYRMISTLTLVDVLDGVFNGLYDKHFVLDCRYPYEYAGGHISGALNVPTTQSLIDTLFKYQKSYERTIVILHCEFSIKRAPSMACFLRSNDREVNKPIYPYLIYPDIYVLEGGYSAFYKNHKRLCTPQNYIQMSDSNFVDDCEMNELLFEGQFKKSKRLN
ncbi:M-phase inducer phosphatase [Smittium mucronatum]|uniref:M-phase inducer phosphatase n=1 Tax=Smittium mucronatum TaxID=133383 RepID=A0A1R0H8J9_9FUNG|nr:M-phase inducer phosphatase [Smittium mucronatum]